MKKRKTYEISIIDKTYSKTISDETKFYTSDTALELVFKLKETEYTFESAEIVLLNTNDKSLITRRVVKSDEGFVYTFEKDIIAHYGEWKAQLMFIENVDAHVASPIKFRIENDLYNTKPQALSDVVSWVNLKLYAEKLVGEFRQAVDRVVAKNVEIENTFKTNEQNRQSRFEVAESEREKGESIRVDTFNTNENQRQTTFEANEIERAETFNTNEDIRQGQELGRETAEATRQTIFNDNESNRDETFNTNEATRQANETSRQQAESQRQSTFEGNETERQTTFETAEQERQSAELIRVSAEEQRKTDHANRSAELAGKADKVVIKNFIENGDVESTYTFEKGSYINFLKTGEIVGQINYTNTQSIIPAVSGHEYYVRAVFSQGTVRERLYFIYEDNSSSYNDGAITETDMVSGIITADKTGNANLRLYGSAGEKIKKSVMTIDLTETFGSGNEPTKEEMDRLIEITGYIDGEYALNNKEMLIWTLALIRRNKNAIITLGGTI